MAIPSKIWHDRISPKGLDLRTYYPQSSPNATASRQINLTDSERFCPDIPSQISLPSIEREAGNFESENHPGLILKERYWRWHQRELAPAVAGTSTFPHLNPPAQPPSGHEGNHRNLKTAREPYDTHPADAQALYEDCAAKTPKSLRPQFRRDYDQQKLRHIPMTEATRSRRQWDANHPRNCGFLP